MRSARLPRYVRSVSLLLLLLLPFLVDAQYCSPTYYLGCSSGYEINDFKITGESGTSIDNMGTGCTSSGIPTSFACYLDNHTTMSVTLFQGGTYTVKASDGAPLGFTPSNFQVWIDFNDDFTFSSGESVAGGALPLLTGALTNFTLTIPGTATLGTHRMRAAVSGEETYPGLSPCPVGGFPPVNQQGEVHDYTVVIAASTTTCPPVTGLTMSAITSSSATLSWTAATGAIGYEWAVTSSATPPASGTFTTAVTANATGLSASTSYYAHVRTKCSSTSFSSWVSTPFTTTGSTTSCDPVTGLTMSAITSGSATLNWTAVSGATGYEWAVTTSATPPASGTSTSLTTATASGLSASTSYYAHVRTVCGSSFSTWSSVPFSTTATSTCPGITGLAVSSITTSSAVVSWSAASGGSIGYQYVIDNVVTAPSGSGANTTTTSTNPTGLTSGTTYYAHVRDSCGVGNFSAWSTIPFTTLSSTCNAPTGLAASSITSSSAVITWTDATGAAAAQYVVNTTAADPTTSGTTTTAGTTTATGLTASTTYYAHVRDSCGATALSAWVTIPLTTLSGSTGTQVAVADFGISAYPNPVKDMITISIAGLISGSATLQLTDISGKLISTSAIAGNSAAIDMSGLSAGIYCIRYVDAEHTQTIKVSKQ